MRDEKFKKEKNTISYSSVNAVEENLETNLKKFIANLKPRIKVSRSTTRNEDLLSLG